MYKTAFNSSSPKSEEEYNLLKVIEASRVLSTDDIKEPHPILKIDGNTVFTLGNISLIMGKAKAKKSFTMALFTSIIAGNSLIHSRLFGNLPDDKKSCLYIDTEQHRAHVFKSLKRIMKLSGAEIEMDNLYMHSLRQFGFKERTSILQLSLKTNPSIGLVIIDGIRDLIADINNATESVEIVGLLMKLSYEHNCHICCVLHQNKGDERARGHLGTELVNKAETIISVTKDDKQPEFSIIKAELTRDKEFEEITFSINNEGLPIISDVDIHYKNDFNPITCDNKFHIDLLSEIFSNNKILPTYSSVTMAIREQLLFMGFNIGINKAKDFQSYYCNVTKQIVKVDTPNKGYMFNNQKAEIDYKSGQFN